MDRRGLWAGVLVAVLWTYAAGECAASIGSTFDDRRITTRINTLFLRNPELSPLNIKTTTRKGVVTLTGSVADEVQKVLAEDLAREVRGVRDVINRLVVVEVPKPRAPRRTLGRRVDDLTVASMIRSRLLYHKQFRGLKIDVKCRNGKVTLSGVVGSEDQKAKIGEIAEDTRGVERVRNNLSVKPKEKVGRVAGLARDMSDEWIEKRVESAVLLNRHIAVRDLNVEVRDGVCVLTGVVSSEDQRVLAEAIASSVHGVQSVTNDILVQVPP